MTLTPPDRFNIFDYYLGQRVARGMGARRALLTDSGSWDYQSVYDLSGRMAHILTDADVVPGDRVLIALPDGLQYVGTLFGILRMGAVVVMVNPHLKPDQIAYFFDYTGARAALVGPDSIDDFREGAMTAEHAPELIEVGTDDFAARLASCPTHFPVADTGVDDPAIWLFSGGTTGKPKAVVQSHRSFANTTELYGKGVLGIGPDDITLSVPKLFFGYATGTNLLFPFASGATAALFPERCTAETLFEKIAAFRPTILVNVPTMVNNLLSHEHIGDQDFSSLRLATSAGGAPR